MLSLDYLRDSTRTSELGTTGLTQVDLPHERVATNVQSSLSLSPRWTVTGQLGWSNDRYLGAAYTGLVDYDYGSASAQTSYLVTERSSVALDLSAGRILIPSERAHSDTIAANLRWQAQLGESWSFACAIGPMRLESESVRDSGIGYSVTLKHSGATTIGDFTLGRDVTPNAFGVLSVRDQAKLSITRRVAERVNLDIAMYWRHNRDLIPQLGLDIYAVSYGDVQAALSWRVTPTLSASMTIGWAQQRVELENRSGTNYRAAIGFVWNGLQHKF